MSKSIFNLMLGLFSFLAITLTASAVVQDKTAKFTDWVKIGGSANAHSSAALDIASITKGLLIPRMTEAERDAIATPATGLQIYNTDTDVFNYWNGSSWEPVGSGTIQGPVSSTDNAIATWNGTDGTELQDSSITIEASDMVFGNGYSIHNEGYGLYLNGAGSSSWGVVKGGLTTTYLTADEYISAFWANTADYGFALGPVGGTAVFELNTAGNAYLTGIHQAHSYVLQHHAFASAPAAPAAGYSNLWFNSDENRLYLRAPAGTDRLIGPLTGSTNINTLEDRNNDAENGTLYWAESGGGTLTTTTSAANVAFGTASFSYDASANNDYASSDPIAVPSGLFGQDCLLEFRYKGFDSNMTALVHDGANIITSQALTASTDFTKVQMNFICPSSGNIEMRLLASADAAIGYWDEVHLGSANNISNVSQATIYGSCYWPNTGNCAWTTGNTGDNFTDFGVDNDCPNPTLVGNANAPSTKVPRCEFTNLPPGEYEVEIHGLFDVENTTTSTHRWTMTDGTTQKGFAQMLENSASHSDPFSNILIGHYSYSAPQNTVSFRPMAAANNSNANDPILDVNATGSNLLIIIKRFPSATQQAVNSNNLPWRIDANISGANIDLGTSNQASYITPNNASLTLTTNPGSSPVGISCSSTNDNASLASTCSAGSEESGITFPVPRAGTIEVCFGFSHSVTTGASGVVNAAFQVVETANGSQTISQEGKERINSAVATSSIQINLPNRNCGTLALSSNGRKTVRLMYEQTITSTVSSNVIIGDASTSIGQRDIHVTARYIDQEQQAPILVGSVTTQTNGPMRMEAADLNCDGSSSITRQFGTWVSSVGNISSGNCSVTLVTGTFSGTPICTATQKDLNNTSHRILHVIANSATSLNIDCELDDSTNCADSDPQIICMGPK